MFLQFAYSGLEKLHSQSDSEKVTQWDSMFTRNQVFDLNPSDAPSGVFRLNPVKRIPGPLGSN